MPGPSKLTAPAHIPQRTRPPGQGSGGPYDAPSIIYGGVGIQDPRLPFGKASGVGNGILGFVGTNLVKVISQVPSAIATANIAALQAVTSGTPVTLVNATGAGITVLASSFLAFPFCNTIPAGTLAIDGLPGITQFGTPSPYTGFYDPATGISRAVSITGVASGSGGTFLVRGYDWFGAPMSQLLTVGAGVNTATTTKAFKFISSVTPNFTDTHTYSVGTSDVFGLNLAADYFADVEVFWNNVLVAGAFTAAVTTNPATTATGDVRGTVGAFGSASNGTIRLDAFVVPSLARLATIPMSQGLFGVPQV